jgi:hypothetical protein
MTAQAVKHPLAVGTKVNYWRSIRVWGRSTITVSEGPQGNQRVHWYRLANGKRVSEYDIEAVMNY